MAEAELWAELLRKAGSGAYKDLQVGAKADALLKSGWMETLTGQISIPVTGMAELGVDPGKRQLDPIVPDLATTEPQHPETVPPQVSLSEEEALEVGKAALRELGIDIDLVLAHIDQVVSTGLS